METNLGPHRFMFPANLYYHQIDPFAGGGMMLAVFWKDFDTPPPGDDPMQSVEDEYRRVSIEAAVGGCPPPHPFYTHDGRLSKFLEQRKMGDILTKEARSERMSQIGSANTKPELIVRRELHALGFRFRLHVRHLPGRPDIVLPKFRTVIFVHGCFWHAHRCQKGRIPAANSSFWREKFRSNQLRDARVTRELRNSSWRVIKVWE
ncbi:very short patch repair endonuclease [Stenotrophomonas muris]|uniref:very short patch repair endonuclease n=1 Tax=Stenotrophomonas muris TaxID=2963283 RepID=UPI00383BA4A5